MLDLDESGATIYTTGWSDGECDCNAAGDDRRMDERDSGSGEGTPNTQEEEERNFRETCAVNCKLITTRSGALPITIDTDASK